MRALVMSGDFPPIVVHRATMRVVDGMHRVRAAMLRGDDEIAVRFFDGAAADAFVLAVRMNVQRRGLPLSLGDRRGAATRILGSHGQWSDRAIASVTGLSHKTVGAIRRRSTGEFAQLSGRVGLDGRIRPVDGDQRRREVGELLVRLPDASLREIARVAGVAPATVRDVRAGLRPGDGPAPPVPHGGSGAGLRGRGPPDTILPTLMGDPSLRLSAPGHVLLRLLVASTVVSRRRAWLIGGIPPHCAAHVAAAARGCARVWLDLAGQIEARYPPEANHPTDGTAGQSGPH
ncbi:MAG: streptomycin biosynthesis protein [Labedaea sp.]